MDEGSLSEMMSQLGYEKEQFFIYKASLCGGSVENFIYFRRIGGIGKPALIAYYGLRNPKGDIFAFRSIKKFGGRATERLEFDERTDCSMRFLFASLQVPWKPWEIFIPNHTDSDLCEIIRKFMESTLFPFVRKLGDLRGFYELLTDDDRRSGWAKTLNAAQRLAQAVAVGRQLNIDIEEIAAKLRPRYRWFPAWPGYNGAEDFIFQVSDFWDHELRGH